MDQSTRTPHTLHTLAAAATQAGQAKSKSRWGARSPARTVMMAICALAAYTDCASADASVELYGEIDTGVTYANPVLQPDGRKAGRLALTGSNVVGSFFGMRGSEDLGGGASAIFTIEKAIDVTNGTGGDGQPMFVGLAHPAWGTMTLGLQYDAVNDYLAPLTLTGSDGGTYFAHLFDTDNANASVLTTNTIKWASPEWAGFRFGGQYAIDPDAAGRQTWSVGGGYTNGPLNIGVSYAQYADVASDEEPVSLIAESLAFKASSKQGGQDFAVAHIGRRVYGAGVSYTLGDATLGAVYTHVRYNGTASPASSSAVSPSIGTTTAAANAGIPGRVDFDNYEVNARYDVHPAVRLSGGFTHTRGTSQAGGSTQHSAWNQVGVLANYAMSRRTDLYVEGVYQRATDSEETAYINGVGASGSDQASIVAMGMRHRF